MITIYNIRKKAVNNMNGHKFNRNTDTYIDNDTKITKSKNRNNIGKMNQLFLKKLWEIASKKIETGKVYFKIENEYGVSFENDSVYLYKVIQEKSVFGYYKVYKKNMSQKEYINLLEIVKDDFSLRYENAPQKMNTPKLKRKKKKVKADNLQYYLFDIESYTVTKTRKTEIEDKAKLRLKEVAQKMWYWKQRIENDNERRFVKSFSYASFSPDVISPYIMFNNQGKLKKGCRKYWNFLKKEVSRLSNIPVKQIIM